MNPSLRAVLLSKQSRPPANILSQFAAGEPGGIWLPHFQKSLFEDEAMTIPAQVGGAVVKMLDLSGRGNTVTFTNVTLQRDEAGLLYLAANGTSSSGVTAAIDFTGTDKITVVEGARKLADTSGMLCELSVSGGATNGSFFIAAPAAAAAEYRFAVRGTQTASYAATTYTAPHTAVLSCVFDIAGADRATELFPRVNGAIPGTLTGTDQANAGTGSFGNHALYFFTRGGSSLFWNGRFYGRIVRGVTSTAGQIADATLYMNRLTGAY